MIEIEENRVKEFRDAGFTVVKKWFVQPKKAVRVANGRVGTKQDLNIRAVKGADLLDLTPLMANFASAALTLLPKNTLMRRSKLRAALHSLPEVCGSSADSTNSRISTLVKHNILEAVEDA